jgi:N-acetyl-gamma-glutamyl-phosphate reductase common form
MSKRVGLVGARGFVGQELLTLLARDPTCEVVVVVSKGAAGQTLAGHTLVDVAPADLAAFRLDGVVLGLSNGQSGPWVKEIGEGVVVVDLSADWRFHCSPAEGSWTYGLVEKNRAALQGTTRIANPGCYSTAAQLALLPFHDVMERAHVFGVSGYSGAGSTPSRKNDTALLHDNLMPYDLLGHTQEKEMRAHADVDVRFLPHVAPFFRGITCTIAIDLRAPLSQADALARLRSRYEQEPLVRVVDGEPLVKDAVGLHSVQIGGLKVEGTRLVVVATIDNLLKGAATQALQNLHLGLGLPELSGIS